MRNKKAMSEIVITVIMVVLALVAVAVIWQIINNLIGEKGTQISVTQKCLDVKLNIQSVSECTIDKCNVTIRRAAGGDEFDGVKVVLKSPTDASKVIDIAGNIEELGTETLTAALVEGDDFDAATSNFVEATVYFIDDSGKPQNCPQKAEYNF
jgi:hypothetical protein